MRDEKAKDRKRMVRRRSASVIVVRVYSPPGTVSSQCTEQLSDMFDQLTLLGTPFVVVGDFDALGVNADKLHYYVTGVFARYGLLQHVAVPTHVDGNILDLILSQSDEGSAQLVSIVSVQSVCCHHLLTCQDGVPPTPPLTTAHTYRPVKKMENEAFCRDILQLKLFDLDVTNADKYAEFIDSEVKPVLDVHAPLRIYKSATLRSARHTVSLRRSPSGHVTSSTTSASLPLDRPRV